MIKIKLSTEEIDILQNLTTKSPIELIRLKSQAILLRSRSVAVDDITFSTRRSYRTVERWIKDYAEQRLSSIFSGKVGNENSAKLTKWQKREIKQLLSEPPNEYGIPPRFWDVPKLKQYVSAVLDVVYESDVSYHLLLKFSDLSLKYPDVVSPRRDEEAIKKESKKSGEKSSTCSEIQAG